MIFNREPVLIAAAIEAIIMVVIAFSDIMTTEELALVMVAVTAVLSLIARDKVTPVSQES